MSGLTISSLTLGSVSFGERVRAASESGFSGIGISVDAYLADQARGVSDTQMPDFLGRHSLRLTEVEFLSDWALGSGCDECVGSKSEATALHIARTFKAERIHAGLFGTWSIDEIARSYAELCRRADGFTVALEFMPFGAIPDLRSAWLILSQASCPNAGLLIDIWHWVRAGMTAADLTGIPAESVCAIQVCDVGPNPLAEQRLESLHHRLVPGEGVGHVADVLAVLARHGISAPVSAEVMSDDLRASGASFVASSVFAGTQRVLAQSGYVAG